VIEGYLFGSLEKKIKMENSITEETIKQLVNQVKAQQSMIETLTQKIGIFSGMHGVGHQRMMVKAGERRDAVEIDSWLEQIKRYGNQFGMTGSEIANLAVFYFKGYNHSFWWFK